MRLLAGVLVGGSLMYVGVEVVRRASRRQRDSAAVGRFGSYQAWGLGIGSGLILILIGIGVIVSATR